MESLDANRDVGSPGGEVNPISDPAESADGVDSEVTLG